MFNQLYLKIIIQKEYNAPAGAIVRTFCFVYFSRMLVFFVQVLM